MIDYGDDFTIFCKVRGSVAPAAVLHALPSTLVALLLVWQGDVTEVSDVRGYFGLTGFDSSVAWQVMTFVVGSLVFFRIKQALGRFWEGTSLLHQMRGEWFDAASCLITFSRDAKVNKGMTLEVSEFRNTLIRLMSLMHGSALDEISGCEEDSYDVIDIHGLDTDTLSFLRDCQSRCNFSKVEAMQHLIQVLVTANFHLGVLAIPAPILSRVYQTLARGFVNLLNARKIKDTMFPLPLAQTIKLLLVVLSLFTPVIMTDITRNFWALLFTFVPLFGLNCLNLIAWQLEMPFGSDSNDLPLHQFQAEMNDTLLMLIDEGSDHLPASSPYAMPVLTKMAVVNAPGTSRSLQDPEMFNQRTVQRLSARRKGERNSLFSRLPLNFGGKPSNDSKFSCDVLRRCVKGDESPNFDMAASDTKSFLSDSFFARRGSKASNVTASGISWSAENSVQSSSGLRLGSEKRAMEPVVEASEGTLEYEALPRTNCDVNASLQQLNSLVTVVTDLQIGYGTTLQMAEKHFHSLSNCLETLKSTGWQVPQNIGTVSRAGPVLQPSCPMGVSTPRTTPRTAYSPRTQSWPKTPRQEVLEDAFVKTSTNRFGSVGGLDTPATWS